jgi:hypothetical protein
MMTPLFPHQATGIEALIRDPHKALFWFPGAGKSRAIVAATEHHVREGAVDTMIVVAPANVRSIWADPNPLLGEVAKWLSPGLPLQSLEYRSGQTALPTKPFDGLTVVVTNPELVRREEHLMRLLKWMDGRRSVLVGDESWQFQNPSAAQTRSVWKLGQAADRVYIANGTPGRIENLYAQYRIFGPQRVFPGIKSFWSYRGRYCRMGGFQNHDVIGYQNVEEWTARTAPYTLLLEGRPAGVDTPVRTQLDVTMTPETWRLYADMRKELVAVLPNGDAAVAPHAGAKLVRLAQITAGFLGGVEASGDLFEGPLVQSTVREVGREKLDGVIRWMTEQPDLPRKVVIFARFRTEVERAARELAVRFPDRVVGMIYGGQKESERAEMKMILAPGGDPRPAIAVVNTQSGGSGLNLAASSLAIFLSNEFSLRLRRQAEGRIDRPGQEGRPMFLDVVASGPKGQATIDRTILAAHRADEDIASWTAGQWKAALTDGS